jgi:predicted dehydrogenase
LSDERARCRWGFLGASTIGRKNWLAVLNSGNGCVTRVASRDLDRARQFIDFCQQRHPFEVSPQGVGGYQAILEDPEIDAVYIALPTGVRKEWVLQAAKCGKHVLSEKPCGVGYQDLLEMTTACAEAGVQFMDGVMFMHSARLPLIRQAIREKIGTLRRITSQFCFCGDDRFQAGDIRVSSDLEPAGCLGDLGWYDIRLSLWAMDFELPVEVQGRLIRGVPGQRGAAEVPLEFSGWMKYANGVESSFYCSFVSAMTQWASLTGTAGEVRMADYALPFYGREPGFELVRSQFDNGTCQFRMHPGIESVSVKEPSDSLPGSQEAKMFETFAKLVASGKPDSYWPMVALKTQRVMNGLLDSAAAGQSLRLVGEKYQEI